MVHTSLVKEIKPKPKFVDYMLRKGDIITFPTEYKVLEQMFNGNPIQFILVQNQIGAVRQFYPSMIYRKFKIYKDGNPTEQTACGQGDVNKWAEQFKTVEEMMNNLKGKTIRIVNIKRVETFNDIKRRVYDIDFIW